MSRPRVLTELELNFGLNQNRIGKNGRLIVSADKKDGRTVFVPLYRRIPYQWQGFHYQDDDDQPFLQLHHSAGGLTGGDTSAMHLRAAPETRVLVTTTEATRYYKTDIIEPAHEVFEFEIESGSVLEYLPDETIPYAQSRAKRDAYFNLKPDSHLIATDILSGGRLAYRGGEMFDFDSFQSRNVVRVDGRSIFMDNMQIDKSNASTVMDSWSGYQVLSTLFAYSNCLDEDLRDEINRMLAEVPDIRFGVSIRNWLLVVKVLTRETWLAHEMIHNTWTLIRPRILNKPSLRIVKG